MPSGLNLLNPFVAVCRCPRRTLGSESELRNVHVQGKKNKNCWRDIRRLVILFCLTAGRLEDSNIGFVAKVQVDARVTVKIVYGCPLSELELALGPLMMFEA